MLLQFQERRICLFFMTLFVFFPWSLVSEIEYVEDDDPFCQEVGLCYHPNTTYTASCYCLKDNCQYYGDCCKDVVIDSNYSTPGNLDCQTVIGLQSSYYTVNTCPPSWEDENVHSLCSKDVADEDYHYMLDIPFQKKGAPFLYANIYCAICNQDLLSENILEVQVECDNCSIENYKYLSGQLRWIDLETNQSITATLRPHIWDLRHCTEAIKDCSSNWSNETTSEKCHSYTNVVKTKSSPQLFYKNMYCAFCNYQPFDNIECNVYRRTTLRYSGFIPGKKAFSALMDFSIENEHCPIGKYLHPTGVCIPTLCGRNFIKENGICVPILSSPSYNTSFLSCAAIAIPIEELHFLPSGSIYHNTTSDIYIQDEYEQFNETLYLVCLKAEDYNYVRTFPSAHGYLSLTCMSISLICLATHIAIQCTIGKYKKFPDKCLQNLSSALFLAQLLYLIGIDATEYKTACLVFAISTHYLYLVVFFWMNVMAFDICLTFSASKHRSNSKKTFLLYSAYAWLIPLCIVSLSVIFDITDVFPDIKPLYGLKMCWICNRFALFILFVLPLVILLLENIFLFSITAYYIYKTIKLTKGMKKSSDSKRFAVYVKLAFIMGGTWILGIVYSLIGHEILAYVFIIFNASQGTFVFLVFTLKKGILKRFWGRIRHGQKVVSTSTYSTTSTSQGF